MSYQTPVKAMNEEPHPKNWLEKVKQLFFNDPKNRAEFLDQLRDNQFKDTIDEDVLTIIEGALQVSDLQVRDIMVPKSKMACVQVDQKPDEFIPLMIEATHSRFPVIGNHKDEIVGILLAKDLLPFFFDKNKNFDMKSLLRPATLIPESKRLNVLLNDFRMNRNHMAVVIDEYGSVAGLVTIEDVLEQIVGDIEDEHDVTAHDLIKKHDDTCYIVNALTPIEEFNKELNCNFVSEEFDTIGGIVMQHFGYLPKQNESVTIDNLMFKVLSADERRINLLQVMLPPQSIG